jgi:hypothetical protein
MLTYSQENALLCFCSSLINCFFCEASNLGLMLSVFLGLISTIILQISDMELSCSDKSLMNNSLEDTCPRYDYRIKKLDVEMNKDRL